MSAVFGLHNWPTLPSGKIAGRSGTIMGAAMQFLVTVTGRGGHAAIPHNNVDPVVAAAQIITSLQVIDAASSSVSVFKKMIFYLDTLIQKIF